MQRIEHFLEGMLFNNRRQLAETPDMGRVMAMARGG